MDGGKFKRKLSEGYIRAVSRRQNELVGKFKVSFRGQVMEYTNIPTRINHNPHQISPTPL